MDRRLIWMIKSSEISHTRKKLHELSERSDLFDEKTINLNSLESVNVLDNYNKAADGGFDIVTYVDPEYPDVFRNISRPPAVLYIMGDKSALCHGAFVGVVGARKADNYGITTATRISAEIAQTGVGIVSGGAEGIDGAAHLGALRAGGKTVAILGSGLDRLYPKCNIDLFHNIAKSGGCVITEYPFGAHPDKRNFPFRNRLISALSQALVVVQGAMRSGSLITADFALQNGQTVFSVPGNINNPLSRGPNTLIRDGATPLLSSMDVIDELMLTIPDFFLSERESKKEVIITPPPVKTEINSASYAQSRKGFSEFESEILDAIEDGRNTLTQIEETISFDPSRLTAILGMLELKGVIKKGFNKKYTILTGGND